MFFCLELSASHTYHKYHHDVRDSLTSSRPDAIQVTPIPNKSKTSSIPHLHQVWHAKFYGYCAELTISKLLTRRYT